MTRRRMMFVLCVCVLLTVAGCATVSKVLSDYEACKGDQVCLDSLVNVKKHAYSLTKASLMDWQFPSVPEGVAILFSNVVAFVFGVTKGRKIKRG